MNGGTGHIFKRRSGMSLVELVVTTALIAIMAGVAMPRFSASTARYQVELAARKLSLDIEQARRYARQTGSAQTVAFDLSNHSYTVPGDVSGAAAGYTVNLADSPFLARVQSATFAASGTQITFDAFGQPTPVANNVITIRCGSQQRTITVNASSGIVTRD